MCYFAPCALVLTRLSLICYPQDHGHFDGVPVANFLRALGMGDLASSFVKAEVDVEALQLLDDMDLAELGVSSAEARWQLLQGITALRAALLGMAQW